MRKRKPLSEEHKRKISLSMRGGNLTSFKKGQVPWNKGLTKELDDRLKRIGEKMSIRMKRLSKEGVIKEWHKKRRIKLDLEKISKEHLKNKKSINDIAKELNISATPILKRLKEEGYEIRERNEMTDRRRLKSSINTKEAMARPEVRKKVLDNRKKQVLPKKDTSIEVKIQNFLDKLQIEYFKHKYMNIEHGYQDGQMQWSSCREVV